MLAEECMFPPVATHVLKLLERYVASGGNQCRKYFPFNVVEEQMK